MKLFAGLVLLPLLLTTATPIATTVTVTVEGVKSSTGEVRIGLFAPSDKWPDKSKLGVSVQAKTGTLKASLEVPPGTWAIAVFHDENKDGELNTNFFGIPNEGYGFSRGAKGSMGAPDFSKAAFIIKAGDNPQTVKVQY